MPRHRLIGIGLVVMLICLLAASAGAEHRTVLAVMEIRHDEAVISEDILHTATSYMRSKLEVSGQYSIVDQSRQEKVLIGQFQQDSYAACVDEACQIELGRQLAADTILRSRITYFAGVCTLTAALVDLTRAASVGGASAEFDCREKGLKQAIDEVLAKLLGKDRPAVSRPESEVASSPIVKKKKYGFMLGARGTIEPYPIGGGGGLFFDYSIFEIFAVGLDFFYYFDKGREPHRIRHIPGIDLSLRLYKRFGLEEIGLKAAGGLVFVSQDQEDEYSSLGWNVQLAPSIILRGEHAGFLIEPAYMVVGWDNPDDGSNLIEHFGFLSLGVVGFL